MYSLKKVEWIIHSIYGVKKFHSLRSEFHSKSNSSRVKIHYSASEISSGSLDIHSKRSDHWRHYSILNSTHNTQNQGDCRGGGGGGGGGGENWEYATKGG